VRASPLALATLVLLSVGACAPQLRVSGSVRGELVRPDAGPTQQALRADARATGSVPLGRGRVDVEATPMLVLPVDGTSVARSQWRARAGFVPDVRARLAPSLRVHAERGTTRASDVAADPAEPRPATATLTAERVGVEAGLRARVGAAGALSVTAQHDAGGGVGADVAQLPRAVRTAAALALSGRGTGSSTITGVVRVERTVIGEARPWAAQSVGAQWQQPVGPGRSVALEGGLLRGATTGESAASLHPAAALRLTQRARGPRPGVELVLAQAAEPDRLDGRVRDRRRVALSIETSAVSTVSFRGSVQGLADAGADAPRQALGADLLMRVRLRGEHRLEYGVAHLVQSLGAGPARGETRLTVAFRSSFVGAPCRNSC